MSFGRYAVFVTPPPGPLADFGAAWLGWDPVMPGGRFRIPISPACRHRSVI